MIGSADCKVEPYRSSAVLLECDTGPAASGTYDVVVSVVAPVVDDDASSPLEALSYVLPGAFTYGDAWTPTVAEARPRIVPVGGELVVSGHRGGTDGLSAASPAEFRSVVLMPAGARAASVSPSDSAVPSALCSLGDDDDTGSVWMDGNVWWHAECDVAAPSGAAGPAGAPGPKEVAAQIAGRREDLGWALPKASGVSIGHTHHTADGTPYQVAVAPVVSWMGPMTGSREGSQRLVVRGAGLGGADVSVGGAECRVVEARDDRLVCLTPALNDIEPLGARVGPAISAATAGDPPLVLAPGTGHGFSGVFYKKPLDDSGGEVGWSLADLYLVRAGAWNDAVVEQHTLLQAEMHLQRDGAATAGSDAALAAVDAADDAVARTRNIATRVTGFFEAPEDGDYAFHIASDDTGFLWVGAPSAEWVEAAGPPAAPPAGHAAPAAWCHGAVKPLAFDVRSQQRSAPLTLRAGQAVLLDAVAIQGGGGHHLSVGVTRVSPDGVARVHSAPDVVEFRATTPSWSGARLNVALSWTASAPGEAAVVPAEEYVCVANDGLAPLQSLRFEVNASGSWIASRMNETTGSLSTWQSSIRVSGASVSDVRRVDEDTGLETVVKTFSIEFDRNQWAFGDDPAVSEGFRVADPSCNTASVDVSFVPHTPEIQGALRITCDDANRCAPAGAVIPVRATCDEVEDAFAVLFPTAGLVGGGVQRCERWGNWITGYVWRLTFDPEAHGGALPALAIDASDVIAQPTLVTGPVVQAVFNPDLRHWPVPPLMIRPAILASDSALVALPRGGLVDVSVRGVLAPCSDLADCLFDADRDDLTPVLMSASPAEVDAFSAPMLTVAGSGFGTVAADLRVVLNGAECVVESATDTSFVCRVQPGGVSGDARVAVARRGHGGASGDVYVRLLSLVVRDVAPLSISPVGATSLVLTVDGLRLDACFDAHAVVLVDLDDATSSAPCKVTSCVAPSTLICRVDATLAAMSGFAPVSGVVSVTVEQSIVSVAEAYPASGFADHRRRAQAAAASTVSSTAPSSVMMSGGPTVRLLSGSAAEDEDECALGTHTCHANAECRNLLDGFDCICLPGYYGDGITCTDVDECEGEGEGHNCDPTRATCTNLPGGFSCSCDAPYWEGSGTSCSDVDECTTANNGGCGSGFTCANVEGGDPICSDIDECALATDNCDVGASCTNVSGSFTCTCQGDLHYFDDGNGGCDFDACYDAPCGFGECSDVVGDATGEAGRVCTCSGGAANSSPGVLGSTCVDVNECLAPGLNDCSDDGSVCTNLDPDKGLYSCACLTGTSLDANGDLADGYVGDGYITSTGCVDLDECDLGTNNCHAGEDCINTSGSFLCNDISCSSTLQSGSCGDLATLLAGEAACTYVQNGANTCNCAAGYSADGQVTGSTTEVVASSVTTCHDIDECATDSDNNCSENAACTNMPGSFTCACYAGFSGDGVTCSDVDECAAGTDNCNTNATCANTDGSFTCACDQGYSGDGVTCTDNNECTDGSAGCDANATCTNTDGSFTCACNQGYEGDGVTCTDIDECASSPCKNGGTCSTPDVGFFSCVCANGYTGDTCDTPGRRSAYEINVCDTGGQNCDVPVYQHSTTAEDTFLFQVSLGYFDAEEPLPVVIQSARLVPVDRVEDAYGNVSFEPAVIDFKSCKQGSTSSGGKGGPGGEVPRCPVVLDLNCCIDADCGTTITATDNKGNTTTVARCPGADLTATNNGQPIALYDAANKTQVVEASYGNSAVPTVGLYTVEVSIFEVTGNSLKTDCARQPLADGCTSVAELQSAVNLRLEVWHVDPPAGSIGGGTRVTIYGWGFAPKQAVALVPVPVSTTFPSGVALCDVDRDNSTFYELVCITRPHCATDASAMDPNAVLCEPRDTTEIGAAGRVVEVAHCPVGQDAADISDLSKYHCWGADGATLSRARSVEDENPPEWGAVGNGSVPEDPGPGLQNLGYVYKDDLTPFISGFAPAFPDLISKDQPLVALAGTFNPALPLVITVGGEECLPLDPAGAVVFNATRAFCVVDPAALVASDASPIVATVSTGLAYFRGAPISALTIAVVPTVEAMSALSPSDGSVVNVSTTAAPVASSALGGQRLRLELHAASPRFDVEATMVWVLGGTWVDQQSIACIVDDVEWGWVECTVARADQRMSQEVYALWNTSGNRALVDLDLVTPVKAGPTVVRDGFVKANWGSGGPEAALVDYFGVRWRSCLFIDAGTALLRPHWSDDLGSFALSGWRAEKNNQTCVNSSNDLVETIVEDCNVAPGTTLHSRFNTGWSNVNGVEGWVPFEAQFQEIAGNASFWIQRNGADIPSDHVAQICPGLHAVAVVSGGSTAEVVDADVTVVNVVHVKGDDDEADVVTGDVVTGFVEDEDFLFLNVTSPLWSGVEKAIAVRLGDFLIDCGWIDDSGLGTNVRCSTSNVPNGTYNVVVETPAGLAWWEPATTAMAVVDRTLRQPPEIPPEFSSATLDASSDTVTICINAFGAALSPFPRVVLRPGGGPIDIAAEPLSVAGTLGCGDSAAPSHWDFLTSDGNALFVSCGTDQGTGNDCITVENLALAAGDFAVGVWVPSGLASSTLTVAPPVLTLGGAGVINESTPIPGAPLALGSSSLSPWLAGSGVEVLTCADKSCSGTCSSVCGGAGTAGCVVHAATNVGFATPEPSTDLFALCVRTHPGGSLVDADKSLSFLPTQDAGPAVVSVARRFPGAPPVVLPLDLESSNLDSTVEGRPAEGSTAGGTWIRVEMSSSVTPEGIYVGSTLCCRGDGSGSGRVGWDTSLNPPQCSFDNSSSSRFDCQVGEPSDGGRSFAEPRDVRVVYKVGATSYVTVPAVDAPGLFTKFEFVDLWSQPSTWGNAFCAPIWSEADSAGQENLRDTCVPADEPGLTVHIPKGANVRLDMSPPRLHALVLEGNLTFDPEADELSLLASYIILNGGNLTVGTEERPFLGRAVITLKGGPDEIELPVYGSKTIAVRSGDLTLVGEERGLTWTRLARSVVSDGEGATDTANTICLVGELAGKWRAGDELVIASSSVHSNEHDVVTLTGVCGDDGFVCAGINNAGNCPVGSTEVVYDPSATPLLHHHLGDVLRGDTLVVDNEMAVTGHVGWDDSLQSSEQFLDRRAEVGRLTRNIVVQGDEDSDETHFGVTIMLHSHGHHLGDITGHAADPEGWVAAHGTEGMSSAILHGGLRKSRMVVKHTEIRRAGQAARLGRYPLHFHMHGDSATSVIEGNSIHRTYNRALTVHGSHGVTISNNVAFDTMGHTYFLEDGVEVHNHFENNLAIHTRRTHSLLNTDSTPASFWITNPYNSFVNNVAGGSEGYGFWYRMLEHPEGPSRTTSVCPMYMPLLRFEGNAAHSNRFYGVRVHPEWHPEEAPCVQSGRQISKARIPAVLTDFRGYSNGMKGFVATQVGAVRLERAIVFDNGSGPTAHKINGKDHGGGIEFTWVVDNRGELQWDRANLDDLAGVDRALIVRRTCQGASCDDADSPHRLDSSRGVRGLITASAQGPRFSSLSSYQNVHFKDWTGAGYNAIETCGKCKARQGGFTSFFSATTVDPAAFVDDVALTPPLGTVLTEWVWQHQGIIHDVDGSLLGEAGRTLHAANPILKHLQDSAGDSLCWNYLSDGAICDSTVEFRRFGLNRVFPWSIHYTAVHIGEIRLRSEPEIAALRAGDAQGLDDLAVIPDPANESVVGHSKYNSDGYQFTLPTQRDFNLRWAPTADLEVPTDGFDLGFMSDARGWNRFVTQQDRAWHHIRVHAWHTSGWIYSPANSRPVKGMTPKRLFSDCGGETAKWSPASFIDASPDYRECGRLPPVPLSVGDEGVVTYSVPGDPPVHGDSFYFSRAVLKADKAQYTMHPFDLEDDPTVPVNGTFAGMAINQHWTYVAPSRTDRPRTVDQSSPDLRMLTRICPDEGCPKPPPPPPPPSREGQLRWSSLYGSNWTPPVVGEGAPECTTTNDCGPAPVNDDDIGTLAYKMCMNRTCCPQQDPPPEGEEPNVYLDICPQSFGLPGLDLLQSPDERPDFVIQVGTDFVVDEAPQDVTFGTITVRGGLTFVQGAAESFIETNNYLDVSSRIASDGRTSPIDVTDWKWSIEQGTSNTKYSIDAEAVVVVGEGAALNACDFRPSGGVPGIDTSTSPPTFLNFDYGTNTKTADFYALCDASLDSEAEWETLLADTELDAEQRAARVAAALDVVCGPVDTPTLPVPHAACFGDNRTYPLDAQAWDKAVRETTTANVRSRCEDQVALPFVNLEFLLAGSREEPKSFGIGNGDEPLVVDGKVIAAYDGAVLALLGTVSGRVDAIADDNIHTVEAPARWARLASVEGALSLPSSTSLYCSSSETDATVLTLGPRRDEMAASEPRAPEYSGWLPGMSVLIASESWNGDDWVKRTIIATSSNNLTVCGPPPVRTLSGRRYVAGDHDVDLSPEVALLGWPASDEGGDSRVITTGTRAGHGVGLIAVAARESRQTIDVLRTQLDPADPHQRGTIDGLSLWGAHVVVADRTTVGRLSGVSFQYCGQALTGDGRGDCLLFHNVDGGSNRDMVYLRDSSFLYVMGAGVGVAKGSINLDVRGNVLVGGFDTSTVRVDAGAANATIVGNLVLGTRKLDNDDGKSSFDLVLPASFATRFSGNHMVRFNAASGSDRIGFDAVGSACDDPESFRGNEASKSLVGLIPRRSGVDGCTLVTDFIAHHNWDFGILTMTGLASDLHLDGVAVLETKHVGLQPLFRGGNADLRELLVSNSLFVGATGDLCNVCAVAAEGVGGCHPNLSPQSHNKGGAFSPAIGLFAPTFAQSYAPGPDHKPWDSLMGYQLVQGSSTWTGTTLAGFGPVKDPSCLQMTYAIGNFPGAPEAFHPVFMENTRVLLGPTDDDGAARTTTARALDPPVAHPEGLFKFSDSDPAWRNLSDCGMDSLDRPVVQTPELDQVSSRMDLNCSGPRHVHIEDLDGSLVGTDASPVVVTGVYAETTATVNNKVVTLARASLWEQNHSVFNATGVGFIDTRSGDATAILEQLNPAPSNSTSGLGISPSDLLDRLDGPYLLDGVWRFMRSDVVLNDKVQRDTTYALPGSPTCEHVPTWSTYLCRGRPQRLFVIESRDMDREDRNSGPVFVRQDGETDVLVAAMDHGWCFGYTCQKRQNTFHTYVAPGASVVTVDMMGTPPRHTRWWVPDLAEGEQVSVEMNFFDTQRRYMWIPSASGAGMGVRVQDAGSWPATVGDAGTDPVGLPTSAHWDQDTSTFYARFVRGGADDKRRYFEIRTEKVVEVSLRLVVSTSDFYLDKFISNLAHLLNIDPSRIVGVEVVFDDGSCAGDNCDDPAGGARRALAQSEASSTGSAVAAFTVVEDPATQAQPVPERAFDTSRNLDVGAVEILPDGTPDPASLEKAAAFVEVMEVIRESAAKSDEAIAEIFKSSVSEAVFVAEADTVPDPTWPSGSLVDIVLALAESAESGELADTIGIVVSSVSLASDDPNVTQAAFGAEGTTRVRAKQDAPERVIPPPPAPTDPAEEATEAAADAPTALATPPATLPAQPRESSSPFSSLTTVVGPGLLGLVVALSAFGLATKRRRERASVVPVGDDDGLASPTGLKAADDVDGDVDAVDEPTILKRSRVAAAPGDGDGPTSPPGTPLQPPRRTRFDSGASSVGSDVALLPPAVRSKSVAAAMADDALPKTASRSSPLRRALLRQISEKMTGGEPSGAALPVDLESPAHRDRLGSGSPSRGAERLAEQSRSRSGSGFGRLVGWGGERTVPDEAAAATAAGAATAAAAERAIAPSVARAMSLDSRRASEAGSEAPLAGPRAPAQDHERAFVRRPSRREREDAVATGPPPTPPAEGAARPSRRVAAASLSAAAAVRPAAPPPPPRGFERWGAPTASVLARRRAAAEERDGNWTDAGSDAGSDAPLRRAASPAGSVGRASSPGYATAAARAAALRRGRDGGDDSSARGRSRPETPEGYERWGAPTASVVARTRLGPGGDSATLASDLGGGTGADRLATAVAASRQSWTRPTPSPRGVAVARAGTGRAEDASLPERRARPGSRPRRTGLGMDGAAEPGDRT